MPQLMVRGIPVEKMRQISKPLLEELADICECGTDNFMIECLHTTSVYEGEIVDSIPFIEVSWFDRGQEKKDRFAEALTKHVQSTGIKDLGICFFAQDKESYYQNGKHF